MQTIENHLTASASSFSSDGAWRCTWKRKWGHEYNERPFGRLTNQCSRCMQSYSIMEMKWVGFHMLDTHDSNTKSLTVTLKVRNMSSWIHKRPCNEKTEPDGIPTMKYSEKGIVLLTWWCCQFAFWSIEGWGDSASASSPTWSWSERSCGQTGIKV